MVVARSGASLSIELLIVISHGGDDKVLVAGVPLASGLLMAVECGLLWWACIMPPALHDAMHCMRARPIPAVSNAIRPRLCCNNSVL